MRSCERCCAEFEAPARMRGHEKRFCSARCQQRFWAEKHPERAALLNSRKNAAYRARHPGEKAVYNRKWRALRTGINVHYINARRARRFENGGSHSLAEWREVVALFGNRCAYCGQRKSLTRDHDIPLSRGGTDDIMNILPACKSCNSRKRNRTAAEFLLHMPTNDSSTGLIRIA